MAMEETRPKTSEVSCCGRRTAGIYRLYSRRISLFIVLAYMVAYPSVLRAEEQAQEKQTQEEQREGPHQLILNSFIAGLFNNYGAMFSFSLKHRYQLYESDRVAFEHNYLMYGLTEEVTPSNSVTNLSLALAPASFFNVELKYSFATEWFYIHVDDVNENYEVSKITDRLDDQTDRIGFGHGLSAAPTVQLQFPVGRDGGIRFKDTGTFHWWWFEREVYYNYITDMLYDSSWNYRNQAYLFYFRPIIGRRRSVEWMIGLSHDVIYISGNGRNKHKLSLMTIFSELPFFGNAHSYFLLEIGAWLHNDYQEESLIPGTPLTALIVYGVETDILKRRTR